MLGLALHYEMEKIMLKKAVLALTGAGLLAVASATPASAATDTGSVVQVCPGVSYSLYDDDGVRLSAAQEANLAGEMNTLCDHAAVPESKASGFGMSPDAFTTDGGYWSGYVALSPGNVSYWASSSSLKTGTTKTLQCTVSWNNGPYTDCGDVTFTGSGASTRTNQVPCPFPDQTVRVTAWLDYDGVYLPDDSAWGVTY
jgi:hypothetical protein